MGQRGTCTNPVGKCDCGLQMKAVPLNESMEPLDLEPSTPPIIRVAELEEGSTPD